VTRYLDGLPYLRRWNDFKRRHSTLARPALQVFAEIRSSGRTVRPRIVAMLDGTGIDVDDLLRLLSNAKLLTIKRGRAGGVYYPPR
jgi:hypothetical protein